MSWVSAFLAGATVLVTAFFATRPWSKPSASGWLLCIICASLAGLLLASDLSAISALLPCEQQPHGPPCSQLTLRPSILSLSCVLAFALLAIAVLALRVRPSSPVQKQSERL